MRRGLRAFRRVRAERPLFGPFPLGPGPLCGLDPCPDRLPARARATLRPKSGQRARKSGPRAPKSVPRSSHERARAAQERTRESQQRPRASQEGPRAGPERPNSGPRAPKSVPRAAQERARATQERTREPQERPKLGLGVLSMLLCNSHVKTCCPSTLGPISERYVH